MTPRAPQPPAPLLRSALRIGVTLLVPELIFLPGDSTAPPELFISHGSDKKVELRPVCLSTGGHFLTVVDPQGSGKGSVHKDIAVMGTGLGALRPTGYPASCVQGWDPCRNSFPYLASAEEPR